MYPNLSKGVKLDRYEQRILTKLNLKGNWVKWSKEKISDWLCTIVWLFVSRKSIEATVETIKANSHAQ